MKDDSLRDDLRFYFMNPCDKYQARKHIPWKLTVQVLKIIMVTTQVRTREARSTRPQETASSVLSGGGGGEKSHFPPPSRHIIIHIDTSKPHPSALQDYNPPQIFVCFPPFLIYFFSHAAKRKQDK